MKYYLLVLLLAAAAGELIARLSALAHGQPAIPWAVAGVCLAAGSS